MSQFPTILARLRDRASAAMLASVAGRRRFLAEEDRALTRLAPDVAAARQRAAELVDRGHRALTVRAGGARASLTAQADALRALSPAATLERGYAVARLADGTVVRDPAQAAVGDTLNVTVARGTLATRVEERKRGAPAMTDAAPAADLAAQPFDELIAELQRIVQALEAGNLPLEESIELYRRGLELHAACETRLRDAELTISQLGRGLTEEPVPAEAEG